MRSIAQVLTSSGALFFSLAVLSSCILPKANLPTPAASVAAGTCEYFGTSFRPPMGWKVEEHKEAGEPISRVSLEGRASGSMHQILLSIIPRALRNAASDRKSQSDAYFKGLRAGMTEWTDVEESTFQAPARTYPVTFGTRIVKGAVSVLDTQQDDAVLLYFPDDFPQGGYFYVFFWTDIHFVGERPVELADLRSIVDSFAIRSSPTTASRGCGPA